MSRKFLGLAMAAAIIASVFGFSMAGSVSAAGTGPGDALTPSGQWNPLAAGQQAWYAFNYAGDGSQITVRLSADQTNAAAFEVWTPDQLQQWGTGDAVTPVGRGAINDYLGGDSIWTGNFDSAGVYYVIVSATGNAINYTLQISGDGVSFPKPAAPAAKPADVKTSAAGKAVPTQVPTQAPTQAPTAPVKKGTGPDDALTAAGKWEALAPGQQAWYAFNSAGDGSQVIARLASDQTDAVGFEVWTPDQLQQWIHGDTVTPVGRGSANDYFGGDLIWTGNFDSAGRYYVIVTNNSAAPANYALTIN